MSSVLCILIVLNINLNAKTISQAAINKTNGDITECMQDAFFTNFGRAWGKLPGEYNDKNGIDGLFVQRDSNGNLTQCMIVDSKYGVSPLGNSRCGKQMSDNCVDDILDRLIKKESRALKPNKKLLKEYSQCKIGNKAIRTRKRIFTNKLSDNGLLTIGSHKISDIDANKAKKGSIDKRYKNNLTVDLANPKNSYDKKVQKNYFSCVSKVLCGKRGEAASINKICVDQMKKQLAKNPQNVKNIVEQKAVAKRKRELLKEVKLCEGKNTKQCIELKKKLKDMNKHIKNKAYHNPKKPTINKELPKSKINKNMVKKLAKTVTKLGVSKKAIDKFSLKVGTIGKTVGAVAVVSELGISLYKYNQDELNYEEVKKSLLKSFIVGTTAVLTEKALLVASISPPPSNAVIVIVIISTVAADYAFDKYQEVKARSYITLDDMLWDVHDDIKNKITVFNLDNIDKETIFDEEVEGESIFDEVSCDRETILE